MAQNDDIRLHQYQDDLDSDDTARDPVMDEAGDDPTRDLQVSPDEYRDEMDKLDLDDDLTREREDMRETIEGRDEEANLK